MSSITPTILLRGVKPVRLLNEYREGKFSRPIPSHCRFPPAVDAIQLSPHSTDSRDPVFTSRDRNNTSLFIAVADYKPFHIFTQDGKPASESGTCEYCGLIYSRGGIGYPVAYEEQMILLEDRIKIVYTFWIEGSFDSFDCALAYVESRLGTTSRGTFLLRTSACLLRMLYRLVHPSAPPLLPANDPRLLKRRGGSLTDEEWSECHHRYQPTERILIIPTKTEHIRHLLLA